MPFGNRNIKTLSACYQKGHDAKPVHKEISSMSLNVNANCFGTIYVFKIIVVPFKDQKQTVFVSIQRNSLL